MSSAFSILIASSDAKTREMARTASESEGFQPILCGDGEEAVESVENPGENRPLRLIVLDAFLPKKDGFEVAKKLEEMPSAREIPVLMLIEPSRQKFEAPSMTRIRLLADDYLQKPLDTEEIRAQIHSMTKHFRPRAALHPVSGLPGHPQLEQEIFSRISAGETLGMVSMDINHFRPFNDHYGTERGNEVIRMAAELIQNVLRSFKFSGEESPFVAHVDGDDFILLVPNRSADEVRQKLRQEFQSEVSKFYSKKERDEGFFYEKDRSQKDRIFPLMGLSTAVLEITLEKFAHYGELVSQINEMLRQAKVGSQEVQ